MREMRCHPPSPIPDSAGCREPFDERERRFDRSSPGDGVSLLRPIGAHDQPAIHIALDPDIG